MSGSEPVARLFASALCLLAALAPAAMAQPDLSRRIGVTVADTGVPGYRFETLRLASADGQRHYRLWLAVPRAPALAAGYPAMWMLDGNAALMETPAALLAEIGKAPHPPVLVYVAYDNDLRIDADARAFDYTPALTASADVTPPETLGGLREGGADAFLDLLIGPMRAAVAARVPLDAARQALWGHSYGGLFTLHALFVKPDAFSTYAAVDPSLWWGQGYLLEEESRRQLPRYPPRVWLLTGDGEAARGKGPPGRTPEQVAAVRRERAKMPPDAAPALVSRLQSAGSQADLHRLPGLSHGQTLGASLPIVLRRLAGLPVPAGEAAR